MRAPKINLLNFYQPLSTPKKQRPGKRKVRQAAGILSGINHRIIISRNCFGLFICAFKRDLDLVAVLYGFDDQFVARKFQDFVGFRFVCVVVSQFDFFAAIR